MSEWTPEDLNTIFFTSAGPESNDTAFKTVRHYWKMKGQSNKTKIISRSLSYHGVAMGATSATGIEEVSLFSVFSRIYQILQTVRSYLLFYVFSQEWDLVE